ncbi:uncharacterized protein LOC126108832 [Schistocerca cancellata]|uniref:uncharacterized protein LOC126108832 n=1 Tax=Schistocerca cancellata TaxID=274614 RepID=UPI0021176B6F|nr:uncharacterized protein LOC126108832 [Schistocerca cancellata]
MSQAVYLRARMATIGSATLTAPLNCNHEAAMAASVALPVYDDEVGRGALPCRGPDDRPERELCPGDSARLSHLDRLAIGRLQEVAASRPAPTSASGTSSTGRPPPAYCTEPAERECLDLGSDLHSEGPALPHGSVGGVGKSEWYPYACYYCECRFKFVSARSMHIVDVHTNLIISSGPNEAEPENRPGDAFGGEDSDRSPGINFDTPKEILALQKASHPWPEPPAEELSPSRAGGHGASQSEWEPQFPQVPASGAEKGSGSAFCLPRVQTDTPSSPKQEIEAIFVNEESPFLQECELPDGPGSARDPLSFEEESEALADDMHSTSNLQSIKKEVHEDLLPVSDCNGFIKEEPDLYVGVDSTENEEASTREDASDITRTGQADPDLPHPGDSRSVVDVPAPDTMTSTGDAASLVSESRGTTTGGGSTTDATFGIIASGADEEQCYGDAGTRPPFSYAELIAMAIVQSPHRRAMLSEIYSYIASRFPYYAARKKFLQKMISNNVARYSCFVKLPQEGGKLKRHYWMLDPQYEHMFESGKFRPRRRVKRPLHSGPVSEGHANRAHSDNGEHRLHGHDSRRRQHRTGMSEHLQLLENATESLLGHSALRAAAGSGRVGGDTLSPPAYPHYPRYENGSVVCKYHHPA